MYLEVTNQDGEVTKFPLSATSVITISEQSDKSQQFGLAGITSVTVVDAPASTAAPVPDPDTLDKQADAPAVVTDTTADPKPFTTTSSTL